MRYLLDVNALVVLGFVNHEFHDRVASWVRAQLAPGAFQDRVVDGGCLTEEGAEL